MTATCEDCGWRPTWGHFAWCRSCTMARAELGELIEDPWDEPDEEERIPALPIASAAPGIEYYMATRPEHFESRLYVNGVSGARDQDKGPLFRVYIIPPPGGHGAWEIAGLDVVIEDAWIVPKRRYALLDRETGMVISS